MTVSRTADGATGSPIVLDGPRPPWPHGETVQAYVAAHARRTPDADAVRYRDVRVSYAELDVASNRLAHELVSRGVGVGDFVGVVLPRSPAFVIALLAVVKAGAAYVALPPVWPGARLRELLDGAGARLCLVPAGSPPSWAADAVGLPAAVADIAPYRETTPPVLAVSGESPCCVFFTSGSTGTPKGVVSPHRATVRTFVGAGYADFGPGRVMLQSAPPSWDGLSLELWSVLLNGGTCLLHDEEYVTVGELRRVIAAGVDTMWLTSSLFNTLVEEDVAAFAGLRQLLVGGERLSVDHVRAVQTAHPALALVNGYGPVEATVFATTHQISADDVAPGARDIPIGRPMPWTQLVVGGPDLEPLAAGEVGELLVAGAGLGLGYLGQPEETAARFVEVPLPGAAVPARCYRTGDLVVADADGVLHYVGRRDRQLKLRGHRVEPGEVERAIRRVPGVANAVVVPLERDGRPVALTAYFTGTAAVGDVRAALDGTLPPYLVPQYLVPLRRLPLLPNGKVDHQALPAPGAPVGGDDGSAVPLSPAEHLVLDLCRALLPDANAGAHTDLFAAGATSLTAIRLAVRLSAALGTDVPVSAVFAARTPAALAAALPAPRDPGEQRTGTPDATGRVPLAPTQEGFWYAEQVAPGNRAAMVVTVLDVAGEVDPDLLTAAVRALAERHPALRTVYPDDDGVPYQRVLDPDAGHLPVTVLDVGDADGYDAAVRAATREPFDLASGPPLRLVVARCGAARAFVALGMHHISVDGWSEGLLVDDLARAYAALATGRSDALGPPPPPYTEFARREHERLSERHTDATFWREAMAGVTPLSLPGADHRAMHPGSTTVSVPVRVGAGELGEVAGLARRLRTTVFPVLLAAWHLALQQAGAGEDLCIGTATANRYFRDLERTVGCFVNTLPLRVVAPPAAGLAGVAEIAAAASAAALDHGRLAFPYVVRAAGAPRTGRNPLFQTAVVLQNNVVPAVDLRGARATVVRRPPLSPMFELTLELWPDPDGSLAGSLHWPDGYLPPGAGERLAAAFVRALRD